MSLRDTMSDAKYLYKRVKLEDVYGSEKNFYRVMDGEDFDKKMIALAWNIQERGLLYPILVKQVGDKYEIIDGETRYTAVSHLYENGIGDGFIDVEIDTSQMNEVEEFKKRKGANIQRTKKNTQILIEIKDCMKEYAQYLEEHNNEKPKSLSQFDENGNPIELSENDYILENLGIAGRTLRKHMQRIRGIESDGGRIDETIEQREPTREEKVKEFKTKMKRNLKNVEIHKNLADELGLTDIKAELENIMEKYNLIIETLEQTV